MATTTKSVSASNFEENREDSASGLAESSHTNDGIDQDAEI
jgi:hypothetical protein